jgi:hypothetical protein
MNDETNTEPHSRLESIQTDFFKMTEKYLVKAFAEMSLSIAALMNLMKEKNIE